MARVNTPPLYATKHHCGARMVITADALGRQRKRCPACDGVARQPSRLAPELAGRSQARHAPPVAPVTLPKNRPALGVLPGFSSVVAAPARTAPVPPRSYEPTEAEMHPRDLPKDHPRRLAWIARCQATKRAKDNGRRQALAERGVVL